MKKITFLIIFLCAIGFSQKKEYFLVCSLEAGQLDTNYKNLSSLTLVNESYNNYYGKLNVGILYELNSTWSTYLGIGQQIKYWYLDGKTPTGDFKITQKQYTPSINLKALYQIPINKEKVLGFAGLGINLDLLDFESVNNSKGSENDFIEAKIEKSNAFIAYVEHEVGIKGYFSNRNQWFISFKYYHPINHYKGVTKGTTNHNSNQINFNTSGKIIGIALKYAFKLKPLKKL